MTDRREGFIQCRKCPRLKLGGPKPGYYYDKSESGFDVVRECDCHKKWRIEKELEAKCEIAKVKTNITWDDYKGTSSLNDIKCLRLFAENFNLNKFRHSMVYIQGNNNTQKTTFAQLVGKEVLKKGYNVQYILMQRLLDILVPDFSSEDLIKEENEILLKRCKNSDLLIIDEAFDTEKVSLYRSGYQIPYLDHFLRQRFDVDKKAILFVSNVEIQDIAKKGFTKSIQSFIDRNTLESRLSFKDDFNRNSMNQINPYALFNL